MGAAVVAVSIAAGGGPVRAEPLITEVRIGAAYHDAGVFGNRKEDGGNLNLETRFRPFGFTRVIFSPRPTIGGSINLSGHTNQLYLGLTWSFQDILVDGLYADLFLGGAVHDGVLSSSDPSEIRQRKQLGSRLLFREAVEVGWRFSGGHRIGVFLDHISNANLASNNEGLDTLGIRYGFDFN